MNFNSKLLKEAQEIERIWDRNRLLFDHKYDRLITTISLESQRLLNEQPPQKDEQKQLFE